MASELRDTTKLVVRIEGVSDSAKNVAAEDSLHVLFTSAIRRSTFEHGFHLLDANGADVAGKFVWRNSAAASFIPSSPMLYGKWYSLHIALDSVIGLGGTRPRDSVLVRRFRIIDESLLSSVAGVVADDSSNVRGTIMIVATNTSVTTDPPKTIRLKELGSFIFPHLLEGKYTLYAFRDTDSNGVYSHGKLFPFQPAERFVVYPDTLKVRARWPLEGVGLRFR